MNTRLLGLALALWLLTTLGWMAWGLPPPPLPGVAQMAGALDAQEVFQREMRALEAQIARAARPGVADTMRGHWQAAMRAHHEQVRHLLAAQDSFRDAACPTPAQD